MCGHWTWTDNGLKGEVCSDCQVAVESLQDAAELFVLIVFQRVWNTTIPTDSQGAVHWLPPHHFLPVEEPLGLQVTGFCRRCRTDRT